MGKTLLVKQTFKGRITFQHTGVAPVDMQTEANRMKSQLDSFYYSLLNHGLEGFTRPKSWMEAFYQLERLLDMLDDGKRQVVFFDELPWMALPARVFYLFGRNPKLKDEFNRLFNAIFNNPEDCRKIIRLLATRHSGFTRVEIAKATSIPFGGGLSVTLTALAESDFVIRYTPYGDKANHVCLLVHGRLLRFSIFFTGVLSSY